MEQSFLYSVERVYPVSMEQMWAAWTEPAQLEKWYSPTELKVVAGSASSETREGGLWAIGVDVSAHGFNAYFWGEYQLVVPNKKLVHTMHYSQDPADFELKDMNTPSHRIEIDFEERDGGTWARFSQFGEMPAEQVELTRKGMESYFNSLEAYLQGINS
ncbi:SRPBCC family protein [Rhodoluna limnophila]|uniref:SRPBCC family protein n=1 Tax=Rhodoluna limnophila TaxID=232537 RepID=UPI0011061C84|nr:SRPBCC domain-containing protein [Rhodoluna limnophila]